MNEPKLLTIGLLLLTGFLSACTSPKKTNLVEATDNAFTLHCRDNSVPTTTFSGTVTDVQTQEPLVQAKVVLRLVDGTKEMGAYTDADGKFTIKNIALGAYDLTATYMGYRELHMWRVGFQKYSVCEADIQLINRPIVVEKPVIYLYPTQIQKVSVRLDYAGQLVHTYPKYPPNGWQVTAEPDGTLWDENQQEYYALFWEGIPTQPLLPETGFVVAGKETAAFLEEKLAYLGLNRREANEFIMYWLPRMEGQAYNFIHFAGSLYEAQAALHIDPQPETVIRVMMLTQPLSRPIQLPVQDLQPLQKTRKGFTVVEWGGSVVDFLRL